MSETFVVYQKQAGDVQDHGPAFQYRAHPIVGVDDTAVAVAFLPMNAERDPGDYPPEFTLHAWSLDRQILEAGAEYVDNAGRVWTMAPPASALLVCPWTWIDFVHGRPVTWICAEQPFRLRD